MPMPSDRGRRPRSSPFMQGFYRTRLRTFLLTVCGTALIVPSGCSLLRKPSVVPESVAACRQYARQGSIAIDRGDWDQAEQYFRQAVDASPVDLEARRHLAEVLWQRGETAKSLQQMELVLRLASNDAPLAVRAGEMHLDLGNTDQAMSYADYAIAIQPDLATAWALRGRSHAKVGNISQALADLHRALAYAPSADDVLLDIAKIYHRSGEPARCLTTIHHVLDLYPPGKEPQEALFLEGLALSELGRLDDAARSLYAASHSGTPRADILYHLADVEFRSGRPDAARSAAQSALATDSNHAPSILLLSKMNRTTITK